MSQGRCECIKCKERVKDSGDVIVSPGEGYQGSEVYVMIIAS